MGKGVGGPKSYDSIETLVLYIYAILPVRYVLICRYCSTSCFDEDWDVHGPWCIKQKVAILYSSYIAKVTTLSLCTFAATV
jgi:hypothetical protein